MSWGPNHLQTVARRLSQASWRIVWVNFTVTALECLPWEASGCGRTTNGLVIWSKPTRVWISYLPSYWSSISWLGWVFTFSLLELEIFPDGCDILIAHSSQHVAMLNYSWFSSLSICIRTLQTVRGKAELQKLFIPARALTLICIHTLYSL